MIFASSSEIKFHLNILCKDYPNVNCSQLDVDMGQQFNYQMQTFFPVEFEKQVIAMMYDYEDAGANPDKQLMDRFVRNLGLSRNEILN